MASNSEFDDLEKQLRGMDLQPHSERVRQRVMEGLERPRRSRAPLMLWLGAQVAAAACILWAMAHFWGGGPGGVTPVIPAPAAAADAGDSFARTYYSATLGALLDNVASFPAADADVETVPQDFPLRRPELLRPRGLAMENGTLYCALAHPAPIGKPIDDFLAINTATRQVLWRASLNENEYFTGQPAVRDGVAYVLVALDAEPPLTVLRAVENGRVLWETEFTQGDRPGIHLLSKPAVRDECIYISDNLAHVWKLERATGKRLEVWPLAKQIKRCANAAHIPTVCGDFVYWLDVDGILHGFALPTMREVWTQQVGLPKPTIHDFAACAPVCDGARVFAISDQGMLFAVRLDDGKILWQKQTDAGPLQSSLAANGNTLCLRCVAGAGSRVIAIAADSGATLWKRDFSNKAHADTLVMTDNAVLAGDRFATGTPENPKYTDQLLALNIADGTTLWTHEWQKAPGRHGIPGVHQQSVFVLNPYGGIDQLTTK